MLNKEKLYEKQNLCYLIFLFFFLIVYSSNAQHKVELWGSTGINGQYNSGFVFKYTPADNSFQKIVHFQNEAEKSDLTEFFPDEKTNLYAIKRIFDTTFKTIILKWTPGKNSYEKVYTFDNKRYFLSPYALTYFNGKFFGLASYVPDPSNPYNSNRNIIFEWDPVLNQVTNKYTFENNLVPFGKLFLNGNKIIGSTELTSLSKGYYFEWDPSLNIITKQLEFNESYVLNANAIGAGHLFSIGSKIYTLRHVSGSVGINVNIFEIDPTANIIIKKAQISPPAGFKIPVINNTPVIINNKLYTYLDLGPPFYNIEMFEIDLLSGATVLYHLFNQNLDEISSSITSSLSVNQGKIYGVVKQKFNNAPFHEDSTLFFEWTPGATSIKKIAYSHESAIGTSFGTFYFSDNKIYAISTDDSKHGLGAIAEVDLIKKKALLKVDFGSTNQGKPLEDFIGNMVYYKGNLYGVTSEGGNYNKGTLFALNVYDKKYSKLFEFDSKSGSIPLGQLILIGGKIYGVTLDGGYGNVLSSPKGTLFAWDIERKSMEKLVDFNRDLISSVQVNGISNIANLIYMLETTGLAGDGATSLLEYNTEAQTIKRIFGFPKETENYAPTGPTEFEGKLYGNLVQKGVGTFDNRDVIYEYNPASNQIKYKVFPIFPGQSFNVSLFGSPVNHNKKWYTLCKNGCTSAGGLVEWDPATNTEKIYCKEGNTSTYVAGDLIVVDSLLFGHTNAGIFYFNPKTKRFRDTLIATVPQTPLYTPRNFQNYLRLVSVASNNVPMVNISFDSVYLCKPDTLSYEFNFYLNDPDLDTITVSGFSSDTSIVKNLNISIKHVTGNQYKCSFFAEPKKGETTLYIQAADNFYGSSETKVTVIVSDTCKRAGRLPSNNSDQTLIYPNPSAGVFKIDNSLEYKTVIEVSDMNGRGVFSEISSNKIISLDLTHLSQGMYMMRLITSKGIEIRKVIILK